VEPPPPPAPLPPPLPPELPPEPLPPPLPPEPLPPPEPPPEPPDPDPDSSIIAIYPPCLFVEGLRVLMNAPEAIQIGLCGSRTRPSEKSLLNPFFINRRAVRLTKNRFVIYLKLLNDATENMFNLCEAHSHRSYKSRTHALKKNTRDAPLDLINHVVSDNARNAGGNL
jgi:hypothetical protein